MQDKKVPELASTNAWRCTKNHAATNSLILQLHCRKIHYSATGGNYPTPDLAIFSCPNHSLDEWGRGEGIRLFRLADLNPDLLQVPLGYSWSWR